MNNINAKPKMNERAFNSGFIFFLNQYQTLKKIFLNSKHYHVTHILIQLTTSDNTTCDWTLTFIHKYMFYIAYKIRVHIRQHFIVFLTSVNYYSIYTFRHAISHSSSFYLLPPILYPDLATSQHTKLHLQLSHFVNNLA